MTPRLLSGIAYRGEQIDTTPTPPPRRHVRMAVAVLAFILFAFGWLLTGCTDTTEAVRSADGTVIDRHIRQADREVLHFVGDATRAAVAPYVRIPARVDKETGK